MSSGYTSRRFQCPFFKWDEKRKVHCEAGVIAMPLPELHQYMDDYCANHPGWKRCPLAESLGSYYDRQESGKTGGG